MSRTSFRLTDAVVCLAVIATFSSLLLPALQLAREDSRLIQCGDNARQTVLAILNKESATQRFPLAMWGGFSKPEIDTDGPVPLAKDDGYSWLATLLPYTNEVKLFDDLMIASNRFTETITGKAFQKDGTLLHDQKIESFLCPTADAHKLETRAKEYPQLRNGWVSNYVGFVAACATTEKQRFAALPTTTGSMLVPKGTSPKGLKIGDCRDGTSKTFVFAETKAKRHNYWLSGRGTSTVAMPPDLINVKAILRNKKNDGFPEPPAGIPTAINYGRNSNTREGSWFAENYPGSPYDWGVSSNHENGKVVHAFVDGRAVTLTSDVSPRVYFRTATHEPGQNQQISVTRSKTFLASHVILRGM